MGPSDHSIVLNRSPLQLVDEFFKQEMGGPRPQEPFQFREMRGQLDHMMPPDLHARPGSFDRQL
jgi:hypothetical protein